MKPNGDQLLFLCFFQNMLLTQSLHFMRISIWWVVITSLQTNLCIRNMTGISFIGYLEKSQQKYKSNIYVFPNKWF